MLHSLYALSLLVIVGELDEQQDVSDTHMGQYVKASTASSNVKC